MASGQRIRCSGRVQGQLMRKILAYALCTAGMIGFYFVARFLTTGISPDFGYGVATGFMICALLFWINERIDKRAGR